MASVDQNGVVIDILVQPKRDRFAANELLPQAAAGHRVPHPHVIVTDKLRNYPAAKRAVMLSVVHRHHRYT